MWRRAHSAIVPTLACLFKSWLPFYRDSGQPDNYQGAENYTIAYWGGGGINDAANAGGINSYICEIDITSCAYSSAPSYL